MSRIYYMQAPPGSTWATESPAQGRVARVLLWLIFAALATGIEVGASFQPTRVFTILALAAIVWGMVPLKRLAVPSRLFLLVGSFWLAWGYASLAWAPDVQRGLRELTAIAFGCVTVLVVTTLTRPSISAFDAIRRGWVAAYAMTLPIAVVEIVLDWHMPQSYGSLAVGGRYVGNIVYAATTFSNRNTYVCFILLCYPFILWSILVSKTRLGRIIYIALAFTAFGLVVVSTSRLGVVSFVLETVVWAIRVMNVRKVRRGLVVAVIITLFSYGAWWIWSNTGPQLQSRYESAVSGSDESIGFRWALVEAGIGFLVDTNGVGVGAGGFQATIMRTVMLGVSLIDPHNLWVEIFAEYGVLVGTAFCTLLVYCAALTFRSRLQDSEGGLAVTHAFVLVCGLPVIAAINSTFATFPMFWAIVAVIVGIADQVWLRRSGVSTT
jgi:hypothetical protein